jgi:NAD(P)-dependent dehydrogenase (short-subunit alcohol dehydrogenase family)
MFRSMEREFESRICVVTGGGSGIGRAVAQRLAAAGAEVTIANRSEESGRAVAQEIGGRFVATDVTDEDSVRALFDAVGPRVDVLVNSAGALVTTARTPQVTLGDWERAFAVNARGTFLACKHALPHMRAGAAIVNVASVAGIVGLPNRAVYCATKGAVIAFTRALAIDHVKDGIRVNCVCPGTIDTPWIDRVVAEHGESRDALTARQPLGRLGTPDEIADAVVHLASDRAAFTTGSQLVVDGGMTAA